ncbi:MAG: hypothetical protein OEU93_17440, partial [Rubrivivax sp.]|nr:hypothetical protein [Rubrivivax sp.]
ATMDPSVTGFGCRPIADRDRTRSRAGVRKPPGKEGAGDRVAGCVRALWGLYERARVKRRACSSFFLVHFFCSTAPHAFFRPDLASSWPTRADGVKAGRAVRGHRRLGLYIVEHDGMLEVSG